MHGRVGGDAPESVEGDVDAEQPGDECQRRQLCLEAHGHQQHEARAHQVLQHLDTGASQWEKINCKYGSSLYF